MEIKNINSSFIKNTSQDLSAKKEQVVQKTQTQEANAYATATHGTKEQIVELVSTMNKSLNPLSTKIKFEFDEQAGSFFVNILDSKEGTVLRRIPSKEAAALAHKMKELVGIIFDETI